MNKQLLKASTPLTSLIRWKGYKYPGGIRYPGGITYYPRHPNHKDPECTPSKLFRVEQIKSSRHHPWWEKKVLSELKLEGLSQVAIVKNIPEMNAKLWTIKHLIKVTPITFPYGEPTEEDIKYTILKENGQCIVTKTLQPELQKLEALEKFENDPKKMDSTTIKKDSRHKWNNAFTGGF
ncbi:39S ribosomal protein L30, mitochondrial [Melitaea cinxia]|uniref:39S ribosomal protein L30, mitochondrial n=1 Tax=Melitaea cinxia TaxID=113334 RepID=UPI0004EA1721|nr:39S ribosomal protein L30, mitochondrial [Melitaea cinxia]